MAEFTLNEALIITNATVGLVIFLCSSYQVLRHKWQIGMPELWAYGLLAGGAIWILATQLQGIAHDVPEVMTNVGIAILLSIGTINDLLCDIAKREANESTE